MSQKYKIPFIISVFILIVTIIYETRTSRHWIYSQIVELFVPKLIKDVKCDSLLLHTSHLILDARDKEEYKLSHIPNSIWIGDDSLALKRASFDIGKREPRYLIYCSIGYRSQLIGKQLQDSLGFNIENLKGGIFRWSQKNMPLMDSSNNTTVKIHSYSPFWGLWKE